MKKFFGLFLMILVSPSFGEIITDFSNLCGVSGYARFYAIPKNFTCESGYFLPANAITCYACPSGYICSGGTYPFNPHIAQGLVRNTYITANMAHACAQNTAPARMYAVPQSFTCASGYFLPANATNCYECPAGYDCAGGTFPFSSRFAQGIIKSSNPTYIATTEHYTCADNMRHVLNGVFTPNTINITWDDGTNTIQNTCTYGDAVSLPETPTRPGYVFSGWKIKTN